MTEARTADEVIAQLKLKLPTFASASGPNP